MRTTTLLLTFLITHASGIRDILTVSKISVQIHQTIIIPCLYNEKYVSSRKYVSSGGVRIFSTEVTHSRMSVEDNQTEKLFTVTLRKAELRDSGTYWCAISNSGYDPSAKLYLEVVKDKARLNVSSQSVSGYEGGSVTVDCHGASRWCRFGDSCVGINEGTSDKTKVHMTGDTLHVTLCELKSEDSGWYYCSDEESQMPVLITVIKAPYKSPVTVQHTGPTTALSEDRSVGLKRLLWLIIPGAMLAVIICAAGVLIRVINRRKHRAEASHPLDGMNNQQLCKGTGENNETTCENVYEQTGVTQNNQVNEKNEDVTSILYESMTGITQKLQYLLAM
ncbi:polymeric immunoglobulin receptor-like [Pseudorasbora parva]|uniref:polymeric immunoglobulin receptor-like n=1 Tax=Pseudorasbora parva TaxID=51549 RepID=UPI00351F00A1